MNWSLLRTPDTCVYVRPREARVWASLPPTVGFFNRAASSEAARKLFLDYRERQKVADLDFNRMRSEAGFWEAEMWGRPVG